MSQSHMASGLLVGDLKHIRMKIISSARYLTADAWFRRRADALTASIEEELQRIFKAGLRSVSDCELLPLSLTDSYDDLDQLASLTY